MRRILISASACEDPPVQPVLWDWHCFLSRLWVGRGHLPMWRGQRVSEKIARMSSATATISVGWKQRTTMAAMTAHDTTGWSHA
jgi:hypothetical protein